MKLTFGPFGGISPRTAPQFLEQNDAQVAQDVKLFSGELRPFYQETEAETLAKTGDSINGEVVGEYGFVVKQEKAHAIISGFSTSK